MSKQGKSSHRQMQTIGNQLAAILPLSQEEQRVQMQEAIALLSQTQSQQEEQQTSQQEHQQSLSALLSLLSSFNEKLKHLEIEQAHLSQQFSQQTQRSALNSEHLNQLSQTQTGISQEMKVLNRKLPHPLSLPLKLVLEGQIFTYQGLILLIAMVVTYAIAFSWLLNQYLPGTLTQINGRVNNIEKRMERIEKKLQSNP